MITFKKFLYEKKLNRGVYAEVTKRLGGALVGFELEVYVPPGTMHHAGDQTDQDRPTVDIAKLNNSRDITAYFKYSTRDHDRMMDAFGTWLADQQDQYIEDHWEDHFDPDASDKKRAETLARKEAARYWSRPGDAWPKWLKDDFSSMYSFIEEFNMSPIYGWAYEDGANSSIFGESASSGGLNAWDSVAKNVAADLAKLLGSKVKVVNDYDYKEEYTVWKIVPDTSILSGDGEDHEEAEGVGLEIVSPTLSVDEGLAALKKVCDFIDKIGAQTNTSTGIHVNLSIPGIKEKLDPLKMVLFMGDDYILKKFDRVKNTYASSQYREILNGIQSEGEVPSSGEELMKLASRSLHTTGKYKTVNLTKLEQGYLEFRAAGGTNYHQRFEDISEAVGRWLRAIDLACDPSKERHKYLKKVAKLLGKTSKAKEGDRAQERREMDLDGLLKSIDKHWDIDFSRIDDKLDQIRAVLEMISVLGRVKDYMPSAKQISQVRALLRKFGITADAIKKSNRVRGGSGESFIERFIEKSQEPKI